MVGYVTSLSLESLETYSFDHKDWVQEHWSDYFYYHQEDIPVLSKNSQGMIYKDPVGNRSDHTSLKLLSTYLSSLGMKLEVYYEDDTCTVIGYNQKYFVIPSDLILISRLRDYDKLDVSSELNGIGTSSLFPVSKDNVYTVSSKIADVKQSLSNMLDEERDIQDMKCEELRDLKSQLDELMTKITNQKEILINQLNEKRLQAESMLAKYRQEIFLLETQIYGIRCYLGEVISFYMIKDGISATLDDPIVVNQKIRYLDEELSRYLSIYDIGDSIDPKDTFLSVLQNRDDLIDLFAPGPKSINMCKISRSGTIKASHCKFNNMLDDYAMYHANQLAILIRDGQRLFISWLDVDKIQLKDDNVFLTDKITYDSESRSMDKVEKRNQLDAIVSRWFIFNILQGILDRKDILSIPEGAKLMNGDSKYIVFSNADGWIYTSKYGSFNSMIQRSQHIPFKEGDYILTGMYLQRNRSSSTYDCWDNDRGIGSRNRTRGVSLPGRTILKVNKVIPGLQVKYVETIYKATLDRIIDGVMWYRDSDGGLSTYQYSDSVFDHYEDDYRVVHTDIVVDTHDLECTISPDSWYGYKGIYNHKKLSSNDLKSLIYNRKSTIFWVSEDGLEHLSINLKEAYENKRDLFYSKITSVEILGEINHQYYCSVKQTGWGGTYSSHNTTYHVNFQFFRDEVIPLTYLCSTWIKDVIQSGDIGEYALCGITMRFSDMTPYLHHILQHLRDREIEEKQLLISQGGESWIEQNDDWDVRICEWRIQNQHSKITKRSARAFLKYVCAI